MGEGFATGGGQLIGRAATVLRDYIPRGNMLDAETFGQRHRLLSWILGCHIPALFAYGLSQGVGVRHSAAELAVPVVVLVLAQLARNRRLAAFFVTAGLVFCSSALVHLSGGTIEAHFHFFVLIGLIALYQDWVPFLWNVVFTVLSHGLGSAIAADLMYNHPAAQNRPWTWAMIHGVAVLAACVGVIVFWKNTELEQHRATALAAELAAAQTEAAQRQTVSDLFVNLARRNQSLLDRQLALIAELEQSTRTPEALAELFQLDHLATRIRRNAESLLVLSGDDPPRRWGRPVPLGEVVRAAAAEVEDYQRVEVLVSEHLEVAGRAVADLAHLFAELIENATRYSPADCEVRVRSYLAPSVESSFVLSIEDTGIGMATDDLRAANDLLAEPLISLDLRGRTMGFHVVSRLARRYRLDVCLAHTPGGGTTALVKLPDELVSERRIVPERAPLHAAPAHLVGAPAGGGHVGVVAHSRPGPEVTADGLVRRVPGAGLTAALRQRSLTSAPAGSATQPRRLRPPSAAPTDRDLTRSMLSRFQASQRAGRVLADAPVGSLARRAGQVGDATVSPEEDP